jgi:uncharacterized protein with HEPN domain
MTGLANMRTSLLTLRSAAADVQAFTVGLESADLAALPEADRRTYRALSGALMEIAELVATLPTELRARHPEVDWRGWIGLRDLLLADGLRREVLRLGPCVEQDLPSLLAAVHVEIERHAA